MLHFVDFVQCLFVAFLLILLEQEIIHRQSDSDFFENRTVLRTPMQIFCILVNSVSGFCKAEGNGHVTVGKRTPRSLSRNYQTPPSLSLSLSLVYLYFLAGYIGRVYTNTTFSLSRVYLSFLAQCIGRKCTDTPLITTEIQISITKIR